MSGPLGGTSASGGSVVGSQSNAPRRRRKNQTSRNNRTQSAQHPNQMGFGQPGPQGHHQQQFGAGPPRGGPGGHLNNQMPPPGMLPHPPQSTGMGWGLSIDEDPVDFILDDLDKLSGRDIASARYRRNHELINLIFDSRKIENLQPSESPYAGKDQEALRSQLNETQNEIEKLQSNHSTKFRRWREELQEHDDLLHAPPKRLKVQLEEEEKKRLEEADIEEVNASGEAIPAWKSMPSKGRILGAGYIRAKTPEEVRKLLPKAPEPEPEPEQKPAVAAGTQAQPAAPTSTGQPLQAVPGASQPVAGANGAPVQQAAVPSLPQAALPEQASNLTDAMQLDGNAEDDEEDEEEDDDDDEGDDDDDEDDGDAEADEDAPDDEDAEADADGDADADESNALPTSQPANETLESADASMAAVGDDTFATAADDAADGAVINAEGIANTNDADMGTNDVLDAEPQSEAKDVVQKSMDAIPPVETIEAVSGEGNAPEESNS
ncbi:uncharacterized protein FA14DRAFT_85376 [Meira miltonrushii]|uniref:Uncharacterized protein n=1 Tax=Meira miltonrushii TaxID=1280837 RepID=A0A316V3N0_9BASI|nr:uncharacterized protein FA14DRAFT_85376 [Meira miltonrushii]PWN32156.1 hypothetical protein FA14DRAFT_85376 [Meira miltonrushii]